MPPAVKVAPATANLDIFWLKHEAAPEKLKTETLKFELAEQRDLHAACLAVHRYPRALLAARRDGALCASCLRCFAETSTGRDASRRGIEGLLLKLALNFSLCMEVVVPFCLQSKAESSEHPSFYLGSTHYLIDWRARILLVSKPAQTADDHKQ